MQQYRQGDVFLEPVQKIPAKVKSIARVAGRLILAEGEVTGHHHAIADREAELLVDDAEQVYLRIMAAPAQLTHEEHATIAIPPGHYKVVIQREYSPLAIRNVAD